MVESVSTLLMRRFEYQCSYPSAVLLLKSLITLDSQETTALAELLYDD